MFTVINERSVWTHFEVVRTKLLLTTFWYIISKKRKSHFFKSEKNVKYAFLNIASHPTQKAILETFFLANLLA